MLTDDLVADLLGDSPQIRPDSPQIRLAETRANTGVSPNSQDSPTLQTQIEGATEPSAPPGKESPTADDGPAATVWRIWTEDAEIDYIVGKPLTAAEIKAEYPDAVHLEPRNPPGPKPQAAPPELVRCAECASFGPNPRNPGAGVGACRIEAPASKRQAPWPQASRRCVDWSSREVKP
jgi:hypothetical protein